jgi:signal transduction histidine kinase
MRPEEIPLVVQPFYRTNSAYDAKHQGAGLGLPFAKAVIELHGGSLAIESRLGSGTTVTIVLPLTHDAIGGDAVPVPVTAGRSLQPESSPGLASPRD